MNFADLVNFADFVKFEWKFAVLETATAVLESVAGFTYFLSCFSLAVVLWILVRRFSFSRTRY